MRIQTGTKQGKDQGGLATLTLHQPAVHRGLKRAAQIRVESKELTCVGQLSVEARKGGRGGGGKGEMKGDDRGFLVCRGSAYIRQAQTPSCA